jgi:gluconokinase
MGPAGAGKTVVGCAVADALGVDFVDADDFHSPEAIASMRRGVPLDDAQRRPWLARLNRKLRARRHRGAVLACSALRRSYRVALATDLPGLCFIALDVRPSVLRQRLAERPGHFAGPDLLDDQVATLELGDDVHVVSGEGPVDAVAREVLDRAGFA